MKKILIFGTAVLCLFAVGCGEKKASKYEQAIAKLAKQHYDDRMSGFEDLNVATVSIEDLEKANEEVAAGYDLTPLKDCKKTSYVDLYIKAGTKEIEKYEYHLECGK